jgi:hypothetical protein
LSGAIWRGLKFYCVYLANFILFIGIAYFFFNPLHIQYANWHFDITYTWKAFFENLFLYKISYSGEWWFAELYLLIIFLIYPLCILLSGNVWRYIFLICLSLALFKTGFSSPCNLYYWQLPFVAGFLISMYRHPIERFINAIPGVMTGCPLMQRILVALVGCAAFGVSWILHCHNQFFLAGFEPLNALVFCFAVLMLLWSMEAIHLFSFLGEWSASMWLNHTFFCYYFFPKFIYGLHNPLLIFSVVTIFSILGAFAVYPILRVLNHFEKLIEQHFSAARPADIEHPTGDAV